MRTKDRRAAACSIGAKRRDRLRGGSQGPELAVVGPGDERELTSPGLRVRRRCPRPRKRRVVAGESVSIILARDHSRYRRCRPRSARQPGRVGCGRAGRRGDDGEQRAGGDEAAPHSWKVWTPAKWQPGLTPMWTWSKCPPVPDDLDTPAAVPDVMAAAGRRDPVGIVGGNAP